MKTLIDVVIPAGGTIGPAYAQRIGTPFRALAPLGPDRTPVLQIVVDALRASGRIGRVIAIAPEAVMSAISGVDTWGRYSANGIENVLNGLSETNGDRAALVCASDLPFLTPAVIDDFCERADPAADLVTGLICETDYLAAFPNAPISEWINLRDAGPATAGCLFQIRPQLVLNNRNLIDRGFHARKSQLKMAGILGPRLIWQFAAKQLRLSALVSRVEQILACRVQIIHDASPALAFDIDTIADFEYAHVRLRQNSKS